jgi:hypothetical protein
MRCARVELRSVRRLGNLRYGRFGNLRYAKEIASLNHGAFLGLSVPKKPPFLFDLQLRDELV